MTEDFDKVKTSKVGDKIKLFNQRRRFNVMARDDNYVILSKPCFNTCLYTIFDFKSKWIAPDYTWGQYDYLDRDESEEALKALQTGELELSRRRGISFEKYDFMFGTIR